MAYDRLQPEDIVALDHSGRIRHGRRRPSSEWRLHRDIYAARPDLHAIIHCHSPAATALACARREIPAFHYMVAVAGGRNIRCAPYALYGTQALSDHAVAALDGRRACLLANHGQISCGTSLEQAHEIAAEVEALATQYMALLQLGEVHLLDDAQMDEVLEKFKSYGQPQAATTPVGPLRRFLHRRRQP